MRNLKERDEILFQYTIFLPGFAQALQLVMTQVIPSLIKVVQKGYSTDV